MLRHEQGLLDLAGGNGVPESAPLRRSDEMIDLLAGLGSPDRGSAARRCYRVEDPGLRRRVAAATTIGFGNRGVFADNAPVEQAKTMSTNALPTQWVAEAAS